MEEAGLGLEAGLLEGGREEGGCGGSSESKRIYEEEDKERSE